jgi:hypothetical protein
MKRNAYQLNLAIAHRLKDLQIIELQLAEAKFYPEAADVRWACILLESSLQEISSRIGKRVNSSRKQK